MNEEKKVEEKGAEKTAPVWRKIVILTDGNNIKIEEANVAGSLELTAILQSLIMHLSEKK